jgi:glutathione S-transferase
MFARPKLLRTAASSPFGRKVEIVARLLGFADLAVVATDITDSADPVRQDNPLGKIPTLLLQDGTAFYDSRVIVEFLDHLAGGGRVIPTDPEARFAVLRLQALADGIMDAAVLQVYESRWREPARREPKWLDLQAGKVERALAVLEAAPPSIATPTPFVGEIAVACALGYLDLRFAGVWRSDHPRLVEFLDAFAAAVPQFATTGVAA